MLERYTDTILKLRKFTFYLRIISCTSQKREMEYLLKIILIWIMKTIRKMMKTNPKGIRKN